MVCACYLLFQATYFAITLGYPLYSLYVLDKLGKTDKKWIYYFFLLILFSLCEYTLLFPLKWILSKIDFCMFPTVKALFALWLYYPEPSGIDFIEKLAGPYIDLAFLKINPIIGKHMEKLGVSNKDTEGQSKKTE